MKIRLNHPAKHTSQKNIPISCRPLAVDTFNIRTRKSLWLGGKWKFTRSNNNYILRNYFPEKRFLRKQTSLPFGYGA
jgi:hypothetical protein